MKRRRTRTPSDAGSPPQETKKTLKSPATTSKSASSTSIKDGPSKSSDVQHAANLEDMEVEKRSASSDVGSFERGTEEIRKLVAEIQKQKLAVRFSNSHSKFFHLLFYADSTYLWKAIGNKGRVRRRPLWANFEGRIILAVKESPKTSRDSNFSSTSSSVPRQVCLLMHLSYTLITIVLM